MKPLLANLPARREIKKIILSLPGGAAVLTTIRSYRREYRKRRHDQSFKDTADVFTHYYHRNFWGDDESRSGPGSSLASTENIRREIPRLIESLGIKRILDAPCGDYNWFRYVQRKDDVYYIGGDIVESLVLRNNEQFKNHNTEFVVLDITSDPLPDADLWLCRDSLFHLPASDVHRVLDRFRKSNIRYFLTSIHPECDENIDILAGEFSLLDLRIPPFNLCEPKLVIEDWVPPHPVRYLALWERSMLE
jgi:SAM-dependent methyltransferase